MKGNDSDRGTMRSRFDAGELRFGGGELGGKANGLVFFKSMLDAELDPASFPEIEVSVPPFAVIGTEFFDEFLTASGLGEIAFDQKTDAEIAREFQRAPLPDRLVSGVRALLAEVHAPLAIRSSSLMEDAVFRPFAGVYETKMVPNNQLDEPARLRKVLEAVKLVYASTFFGGARRYMHAAGKAVRDEKMAVLIQEVVGTRSGDRFYPLLSGVGRSWNFYPTGGAKPSDGVVSLALGLGKTIVDGGICWTFSPLRPKAPPPYGSIRDLLDLTQTRFWAVSMVPPAEDDPTAETENLVLTGLPDAEEDGALRLVASTYDARSDRLLPGLRPEGPRVVDFSPMLVHGELPLNAIVKELLAICQRAAGAAVEIEFALSRASSPDGRPRLGFLQVRPMFVSHEMVEIADDELEREDLLLASAQAMGNGNASGIRDIVFVKPDAFEARSSRAIADEVEAINTALFDSGRPYLLIGFGRWGSSDPWLGIPVDWGQICGAKVIVEATLPSMDVEASQGAHFFHNISGNGVLYLSVHHGAEPGIDWDWLRARPPGRETRYLRHLELPGPLDVRVDGRSGRGGVWRVGEP